MCNRLLLCLLFVSSVFGCDPGWSEFQSWCYKILTPIRQDVDTSYEEREKMCVAEGANLASVMNPEQFAFLANIGGNNDTYTGIKWNNVSQQFVHPVLQYDENFLLCYSRIENTDGYPNDDCTTIELSSKCVRPTLCSFRNVNFACQKRPTPTTTTKKPTTTTPRLVQITDPKKWITDYSKGTQIHRSFHSGQSVHHYTIDWRNTPNGFNREVGNGFVVSEDRFPELKATCPNLLKVGVWRYGAMTYIGNYPPGSFVKQESFYCAPSQFYCGANFLLRRLDKNGGGDIFYASNENEANQQLLGFPSSAFSANWYKETPCWIWQDYTDTWYSIVKANGGMIWSGYNAPEIVHFYTLQRHLVPAGFQKEQAAPPGYVVMQTLYDSYFKTQCPELIPMKIWHGQNGAGQTITWIGREGRNPPAAMKNGQPEELRFYCAPRFNYCNANYLLRRMDKTNGAISFYYPWSESNAAEQLRGVAPGVFKNSKWSEEVCYIWANWY